MGSATNSGRARTEVLLGTLYVADQGNHRIRHIATAGVFTTLAGTGTLGVSGDGGAATDAELAYPDGVTVGPAGTLYVADTNNNLIRHIDAAGIITTGPVDPEGVGPIAQAHLADPRAFVVAAPFSVFAGGSSGTLQASRAGSLAVVAGRSTGVGRAVCAVLDDRSLWCWGDTRDGGFPTTVAAPFTLPVQIGVALDWRDVALGDYHGCGIRDPGTLWC